MRKKRISAILLTVLLLCSCTNSSDIGEDTSTNPVDNVGETETVETTVDDLFAITKEENGDKQFNILTTETHDYEMNAPEINGEVVNDAVYHRNAAVNELLGIKLNIECRPGDWANRESYCALITNSVLAGDGAYDMAFGMISCVQPIAQPGVFMNVLNLEHINFDNPWWVSDMEKDLSINGQLIGFIGDMSLSMYKGFPVIFANMNLIENANLENPQDMVFDGKWTLEKMIEMTSDIGQDLDGDGTYTQGTDILAMAIQYQAYWAMQSSLCLYTVSTSDAGIPEVLSLTENYAHASDVLTAWLKNKDITVDSFNNANRSVISGYFAADKMVYFMTKLENLDFLRDMESDFTVLPYPKYDENQSNYRTTLATATQMTYIPATTQDSTLTGKVCEALSYYSYKDVVPAYYDVVLKGKYSRDENTQKLVDIIRQGAVLPFDYAYNTLVGGSNVSPDNILSYATYEMDGNIASLLESLRSAYEASIDSMLEAYQ